MIRVAAGCSFCTAELEVTGVNRDQVDELAAQLRRDPGALEPGWRTVQIDDYEIVTVCPRCHVAFGTLIAALETGLDQVLERRKKLWGPRS